MLRALTGLPQDAMREPACVQALTPQQFSRHFIALSQLAAPARAKRREHMKKDCLSA
jgi:hypothetical protein